MKLTPEDFDKLHTKKVANIIRKLRAGKTLTKREEEILEQEKSRGAGDADQAGNFASSWDELARMLSERSGVSITRRAIQEWRRDPRYEDSWPEDRPDCRKNVQAWILFMRRFGLNRADEVVDDDEIPEERRTIRDWKEHREKLLCEKLEREILRDDGKLLIAIDLEIALGQLIAGVSVALDYFAPSASRFVVGLRDIHDVQAKLQSEIDAVKQRINAACYLDDCIDEVAQSFPFDDETEELYKRVSFSGQDRDAFVDLVRRATTRALQALGRRTLASVAESKIETNASENAPSTPEASPTRGAVSAKGEVNTNASSRKRRSVTRRRKRARDQASGAK